MKLLSIAVPCYNSEAYMRHCIDTLLTGGDEVEILIVDEALSVGDIFFQAKCYQHMDKLRKNGTTILMVTHDMNLPVISSHIIYFNDGIKDNKMIYDLAQKFGISTRIVNL